MTDDRTNPKRDRAPAHPPMPEPTAWDRLVHALEDAGIDPIRAERIADAVMLVAQGTD